MKFSVYEVGQNSSFVLFVTEISYHMYRKNAVLNGKQKQMKPLLYCLVQTSFYKRRLVNKEQNLWFCLSLALDLSLSSCNKKSSSDNYFHSKWVLRELWLHFSEYILRHFKWNKLSFDDFLMTTLKQQVES